MPGEADMAVTPEIRRKRPELIRRPNLAESQAAHHAMPSLTWGTTGFAAVQGAGRSILES